MFVHEIEKLNDQMTSYISIIIAGNRNASQLKKTNSINQSFSGMQSSGKFCQMTVVHNKSIYSQTW